MKRNQDESAAIDNSRVAPAIRPAGSKNRVPSSKGTNRAAKGTIVPKFTYAGQLVRASSGLRTLVLAHHPTMPASLRSAALLLVLSLRVTADQHLRHTVPGTDTELGAHINQTSKAQNGNP